jgi:hypothetical protein
LAVQKSPKSDGTARRIISGVSDRPLSLHQPKLRLTLPDAYPEETGAAPKIAKILISWRTRHDSNV